jgi:hypothetical protein
MAKKRGKGGPLIIQGIACYLHTSLSQTWDVGLAERGVSLLCLRHPLVLRLSKSSYPQSALKEGVVIQSRRSTVKLRRLATLLTLC